jgi:hypothetical protein
VFKDYQFSVDNQIALVPALRIQHFLLVEAGSVTLVDRHHHVVPRQGEGLFAAVVVVHHARGGRRFGMDHVILALAGIADGFRQMVVKRDVDASDVRQVGRNIVVADGDFAILHVLRMDEQDFVDHIQVLQQYCAHQPIEVAACYQTIFSFCRHECTPSQLNISPRTLPSGAIANDTTQFCACTAIGSARCVEAIVTAVQTKKSPDQIFWKGLF